jgi:hypothetical protein
MNSRIIAVVMIAMLPSILLASPAKKVKAKAPAAVSASVYECSVCHMQYSAADAKKDHYKDSMDGGKLLPVKPAVKSTAKSGAGTSPMTPDQYDKAHPSDGNSMPGMKM